MVHLGRWAVDCFSTVCHLQYIICVTLLSQIILKAPIMNADRAAFFNFRQRGGGFNTFIQQTNVSGSAHAVV